MTRGRLFNFFLFSFLAIATLFSAKTTFAVDNAFLQKQAAIKQGTGLESWTSEAMSSNMMSLFNGMVGEIPASIFDTGASATSVIQNYVPGGAFGTMNKMVASLNTPPASGIEYIAQVKDNFLGKPAYAQGVGFQGLQFLLPLWRGFRNAVYVLTSIIFVAIGIMIMLRVKISPQAVVTVQSAIPQLITTLILVTFSYAIAGLAIDLANLIQALVVALLFSVNGTNLNENLFTVNKWFGQSSGFPILGDIGNFFASLLGGNNSFSFSSLSNPDLHNMQLLTYRAVPGWISLTMLGGLLGSIVIGFFLGGIGNMVSGAYGSTVLDVVGRVVGGAGGGLIGGLLIPIILCIIVAIWLIKLYFGLLKCYVSIIFTIVLAPLEIGMGAFPNSKMGFSSWIINLVSNVSVFPIVGIFLVLLNMITDAVNGSVLSSVWAPSLFSAGGVTPSIISAAIGLAGLALLAKLPDMVPQFIFMIKPSPWGQAIGQGFGDIGKPAKFGGQMAMERGAAVSQERAEAPGAHGITKFLGTAADAAETMGLVKGKKR